MPSRLPRPPSTDLEAPCVSSLPPTCAPVRAAAVVSALALTLLITSTPLRQERLRLGAVDRSLRRAAARPVPRRSRRPRRNGSGRPRYKQTRPPQPRQSGLPWPFSRPPDQHLAAISGRLGRTPRLVFRYRAAANGAALKISAEEAARIRQLDFVRSVVPDSVHPLTTDRGPIWDWREHDLGGHLVHRVRHRARARSSG